MKAIRKLSVGCTFCSLIVTGAAANAGASSTYMPLVMSQFSLMGQADPSSPGERRRQSDQLLRLTRQAMKEGKLDLAEKHLARAEQLGASYESLFARFEDSPEKVRRDLRQLKAGTASRPSTRVTPYDLKSGDTQAPPPAPFGRPDQNSVVDKLANESKVKASDYLQRGRDALRRGDKIGATGWWQRAVATGAKFEANEYSPNQLASELRAAGVDRSRLTPPASTPSGPRLKPADVARNELHRLPPPSNQSPAPPPGGFQQPPLAPHASTPQATLAMGPPSQLITPSRSSPIAPQTLANKKRAQKWVAEGNAALARGDVASAQRFAQQAEQLAVPDAAFVAGETRPWELALKVERALRLRGRDQGVVAAGFVEPQPSSKATASLRSYPVKHGIYDPGTDSTRTRLVQAEVAPTAPAPGMQLFQQGLRALEEQNTQGALELFRQAWQFEAELDPLSRQELKDKLSLLSSISAGGREPSRFEQVDTQQELLRQQIFREISNEEKAAQQQLRNNPKGAYERMQRLRDRVAKSELDTATQRQFLNMVDRQVNDLQAYLDQHRAEIELNEQNRNVLDAIDRERAEKAQMQDKVAELVETFNSLLEEERFDEADVIAKQVRELTPDSPIARTLLLKSSFVSRIRAEQMIGDRSEEGFVGVLHSVGESGIPFDDREPFVFGDAKRWKQLSQSRGQLLELQRRRLSPREMEIQQALEQRVDVSFSNQPIKEVLDTLGSIAGINIYPDVEGMSAEGVSTDTPVNITLSQPIKLKSALNLILEPLRLSYVIQHEVLRITSEQSRDSNVFIKTYNVGDLVIPIPNFVPGHNLGLPAALRDSYRSLGYGGIGHPAALSGGPLTIASNDVVQPTSLSSNVLAQSNAYGMLPQPNAGPPRMAGPPGSAGGAALADFDTLIDLITSTVEPDSWDTIGGPGAIESFPTNLSLVISQTQDVHDQIADLLEQLRRLQDLQVTIEVRFITLQDNWFERIGVDFDFDIDDNVQSVPFDDSGNSVTIGLDNAGNPTADLDLSFNQGSFGLAAPAFGGFQAQNAASFGFAILSDIEAFFLLQAATGDTRSNVLQAPKVTLFNGQIANVSDASQRPFVTSLIPVVGDFAAAHQPVIVVLSEGTSLNVQAVVSSDRRFVRLTLQPVFSQIGNVETFTFEGSTTTDSGQTVVDANGQATGNVNNVATTTTGTTVQLPTFSFTTVGTTVSVPDGGTILLGGIKRLQEGRNEHGVPMLSKVPYFNRLFRNVGIGRTTQSLMLMVTPRIIIQEEEESRLGADP